MQMTKTAQIHQVDSAGLELLDFFSWGSLLGGGAGAQSWLSQARAKFSQVTTRLFFLHNFAKDFFSHITENRSLE
jgi:hypothetical protein